MRFVAALAGALRPSGDARPTCFGCAYFRNDRESIESALPGLSSFSSATASVRADDGVCTLHETIVNGRRACGGYVLAMAAEVARGPSPSS